MAVDRSSAGAGVSRRSSCTYIHSIRTFTYIHVHTSTHLAMYVSHRGSHYGDAYVMDRCVDGSTHHPHAISVLSRHAHSIPCDGCHPHPHPPHRFHPTPSPHRCAPHHIASIITHSTLRIDNIPSSPHHIRMHPMRIYTRILSYAVSADHDERRQDEAECDDT